MGVDDLDDFRDGFSLDAICRLSFYCRKLRFSVRKQGGFAFFYFNIFADFRFLVDLLFLRSRWG